MKRILTLLFLFLLIASSGWAATRSSVATDNFNRANGGAGANWSDLNNGWGTVSIVSNRLDSSSNQIASNAIAARWNGAGTFANDQYAKAVWVGPVEFGGTSNIAGVLCRASADTNANRDFYMAFVLNNVSGSGARPLVLGKTVNGTYTQLATSNVVWVAGDTVEIECEGTTIRSMRNGTEVSSVTDSDLSSGKPGAMPAGGEPLDDWEGGDLTAGSVRRRVQVY